MTGSRTTPRWRWGVTALVGLAAFVHVARILWDTTDPAVRRAHRASIFPRSAGELHERLSRIRFDDERSYYAYCAEQAANQGWSFLRSEDSLRSPPLPWLWLMFWGRSIALTRLANIAITIAASVLLARIIRDQFGERMGLLGLALAAMGYQVVVYSGTVLTEPLAFALVVVLLWAVYRFGATGRLRFALLAGTVAGLAALARPALQLLPLMLALIWVVGRLLRSDGRIRPAALVLFVCGFGVIVLPWVAKNRLIFDRARIANGFGAVAYLGSDLRTAGDEPPFYGMDYTTGQITGALTHMHIAGDARLMDAAVDNIRRHTWPWARLIPRKIGRILIGGPTWHFFMVGDFAAARRAYGRTATLTSFIWWTVAGTVVTVFGIAGLVLAARTHPLLALTGVGVTGYLVLLHAVSFSIPRFAVPFYPALVWGACAYFAQRRRRTLTVVLALVVAGIAAHLALYHRYVPRHVVDDDQLRHFTVDRAWRIDEPPTTRALLDARGISGPFNGCLFVRATAAPQRSGDPPIVSLALRHAEASDFGDSAVVFGLLADGREHLYRMCVQHLAGWTGSTWAEIKLAVAGDPGTVTIREVILAH